MLYGYTAIIAHGTWVTLELTIFSVLLAIVLGLLCASAKLSKNRPLKALAATYTTLIRSVPDLVMMLLLYYNLQLLLNHLTNWLGATQIDINPLVAGVITLGFIYGAYFTETFRGAYLAVPKGQIEAAQAFGMSPWIVFSRITFPQLIHFAIPGASNNLQVVIKSTALVSIIGLQDIVKTTQIAGSATMQLLFFSVTAGVIYLAIATITGFLLNKLQVHFNAGFRSALL